MSFTDSIHHFHLVMVILDISTSDDDSLHSPQSRVLPVLLGMPGLGWNAAM